VDYHSDIFSLGCILYELITGTQPFRRGSTAQTLAAIIEDDPQSLVEANPKTPTPLRWVVERCMAKDADERYSSTLDLARDLKSIRDHLSDTSTSGATPQPTLRTKRSNWIMPAVFAVSGIILGGLLGMWLKPEPFVPTPSVHTITFSGNDFEPSVSPDGHTVAFVSGRDGTFRIWLKQIDSGSETVLTPGPDDGSPRFSPDGAWVLFIHKRAAYRIPSIGEDTRRLLDNVDDAGWSPDGRQIAFVRFEGGGTKVGVASLQDGNSRVIHEIRNAHLHAPSWSPDGRTIALIPETTGTVGFFHGLFLLSPDGHEHVGNFQQSLVGSAGHVLLQDIGSGKVRTLFTVQAPVFRIEIAGPGRVIFDSLAQRGNLRLFSSSSPGPAGGRWLTRGNSIDRQPYFSPDGASVIFSSSRGGDVDLWEVSLKSGTLRRLTDHPALDWDPFISSDNQHLVWSSNRTGNFEVWVAERDGSSPRQVSHDGSDAENPVVTPDGWVLYARPTTTPGALQGRS
jgi:eukaryotic-like serine/threonine-protein kinase